MKSALFLAAAVAFAAMATPASATDGDAGHGKTVFARCAACHDLNSGRTVLGPTLKGIVGRKSGSIAGFAYSPAMKDRDIDWTPANLDAFIAAPTKYVPGTRMPFAGLPNARDRADLIAYLQQAAR